MSGGTACKERSHRASGAWLVVQRKMNASSFNGGRATPSAYSCVKCVDCGAIWRTKANYVDGLPGDATIKEPA